MRPEFVLSDTADKDNQAAILDALKAYNVGRFGESDRRELSISLQDSDSKTTRGLVGYTGRGWLYISLLFVPEELRGQGIGPKLLTMAEGEARNRGCIGVYIDTMSPDALKIYLRHGFSRIGELDHLAGGHIVTWLAKRF